MPRHHEEAPSSKDANAEPEVHPVAVASLPWQEAWLLVGRLRSEGIPARVYPDFYASPIVAAQAFAPNELGEIGLGRTTFDVMVPKEFAERAVAIIRRIDHPSPE